MSKLFRQWTSQYQDQVWSLARYLLQDPTEAEDVSQDAFIRLWHHRETVSDTSVKPWLLKVTRNLCLDRLRRRHTWSELEETPAAEGEGPLQRFQQSELAARLQTAIARLQEPYRSLVVLRDLQQHSYEEVAGVMDLSLAQVKTYLHRARRQLRQQLAEVKP
jgi:RNA polymerase sigma-70 factor (ECF subfamily)